MIIPTIHANGSGKKRLTLALEAASEAIELAYQKLKGTAPNPRDYDDDYMQATEEHLDRMRRVDAVKEEIDRLTREIDAIR